MNEIHRFFLNGKVYISDKTLTIADLLKYFNYNLSLIVVEYNFSICSKHKWEETYISNNDKIEIVTIVGGG